MNKFSSSCSKLIENSFENVTNDILYISERFGEDVDKRDEYSKIILDLNVVNRLYTFYKYLHKDEYGIKNYYRSTITLYILLLNLTDHDERIVSLLMETSIPDYLIKDAIKFPNSNIQRQSLSILMNMARYPGNEHRFKIPKLKRYLIDTLNNANDSELILICLLTLALTLQEKEKEILTKNKDIVNLLFGYCITARSDENHRYEGFSLWELLNGLRCICVNDDMKIYFKNEAILNFLKDIIVNNPKHIKEIEQVLWIISNLCFDKEIKELINKIFDLSKLLNEHCNKTPKITEICNNIRFENGLTKIPTIKSDNFKYDIFLSHANKDKQKLTELITKLQNNQFKLWLDSNEMGSDTLESMAQGINNSKIFIMCISELYRTSNNCRCEAGYAHRYNKPTIIITLKKDFYPRDWLGLLIESKKRYNFDNGDILDDIYKKLTVELKRLSTANTIDIDSIDGGGDGAGQVKDTSYEDKFTKLVCEWNEDKVNIWMKERKLDNILHKLEPCDGSMLIGILDEIKTGEYQNSMEKLGLDVKERLKLRGELINFRYNWNN